IILALVQIFVLLLRRPDESVNLEQTPPSRERNNMVMMMMMMMTNGQNNGFLNKTEAR
ncbi:MAG: hypothetical protein ACI90V_003939, partial [Bacillariaceae sp.]